MIDNTFVNLIVVLIEVGRETDHKLIEESTQAVDVCLPIVALSEKDLWTHVFWGPTE